MTDYEAAVREILTEHVVPPYRYIDRAVELLVELHKASQPTEKGTP